MRVKKSLNWVFLAVVLLWVIATVFFYYQHQIQVETYTIGKYIEYEEFGVFIKNVEGYDNEKKGEIYPFWMTEFKLPLKVTMAIFNIRNFYSLPYERDNSTQKYDINCEIIYDPEVVDFERLKYLLSDKFNYKKFNLSLYNSDSSVPIDIAKDDSSEPINIYDSSYGHSSDQNIIHFTTTGDWQQNFHGGMKVITGENAEVLIIPFDHQTSFSTYDYFNRRLLDERDTSSIFIRNFTWDYYNGKKDGSLLFVKEDYADDFPWIKLNQYENFHIDGYELSYSGHHMKDDQVFIMKVIDSSEDNEGLKELHFYMVYDELGWHIIDLS